MMCPYLLHDMHELFVHELCVHGGVLAVAMTGKQPKPNTVQANRKQKRSRRQKLPRAVVMGEDNARALVRRAFAARGAKDEMQDLCLAIADPGSMRGFRLPTVNMPRTAVFTSDDNFTLSSPATAAPGFDPGTICVAFFGQMGRTFSAWQAIGTGAYDCFFSAGASTWPCHQQTGAGFNSHFWPLIACRQSLTGPHGTTMAIGVSQGIPYVFLNVGDKINVSAGTWGTGTGNAYFSIFKFEAAVRPSPAGVAAVVITAGSLPATTLFTATVAGYYALKFDAATLTAGAYAASNSVQPKVQCNATFGWEQHAMMDIDEGAALGGDATLAELSRVNAASLLLTNTSAALNKQGTVIAGRIRTSNYLDVTPDELARTVAKYSDDAAKGVYTFRENTESMEKLRPSTYQNTLAGGQAGIFFDLDEVDYVHYISITCPGYATQPNNYTVLNHQTIEFDSDTSRYDPNTAGKAYTTPMLIEARRLINSRPEWFFENPLHLRDIYSFIRRGLNSTGRFLGTYGPPATRAGALMMPESAPAMAALGTLFSLMKPHQ